MPKPKRTYVTRRDRRVLEFVDRYRLGTPELLAIGVFGGGQTENVIRVLRKLIRRGYLRRIDIAAGQFYVVLTRRGSGAIGAADRTPRPLTEQSLPTVLAIAAYCVRSGRPRLTDAEFRDRFPELWRPGLRSSRYCLRETDAGLVLTMFIVDRGGTSRRIRSKIRRIGAQRRALPAFHTLMTAGRFQVCVLTSNRHHEQNIRRQLPRLHDQPVDVDVAVVPELGFPFTSGAVR